MIRGAKLASRAGLAALAVTLAAAPALAQKKGGDINVLLYAGFNSIDPHFTATYPARNALLGMYETLVTVDENGSTIPMLCEKVDISADGLTYRFPLRKGVKFHNGKEMTSADVKASLERYARISPQRVALEPIKSIETPDPYLVVVTLKASNPNFLDRLAAPTSPVSIIPTEEAAKDLNKTNNISTGPFQFVEWIPDSHFKIKRFDGYVADKSMPQMTGFGGPKTVYLDTVTLRVVAEASARVATLEAGQAHFIEDVPGPAAQRLASNPKVKVLDLPTFQMPVLYLNHALAPTSNLDLRKAIQAALDMDEVMGAAAAGAPYVLQHAWTYRGHALYSEAGKSLYDQHNMGRAKELLKASGYKGEEILFNVGNLGFMSRLGVVVAQSLKEAGLNVRVSTMDLGTLFDISGRDEGWHMTTSGYGSQPFLGPYMYEQISVGPANLARRKGDAEMEAIWKDFDSATTQAAKKAAWDKYQQRSYDEVYFVKLGDLGMKYAAVANLAGFKAYAGALRFWNAWLE